MSAVLGTNVLLSALISPHGTPDVIYRAWRAARFELVTSRAQLDELRRASRYPKFKAVLQPHRVGTMVNNLQRALVLERLPTDIEADDPFDAFLLAMAVAGDADYLVTGDHRAGLVQREHIGRCRIATPATFCAVALPATAVPPYR
ncbi:MAG: putative toxin-antitoxin system toxin component, PIN family [Rubrivivax sp.]|nr:putative toxin-antitoxin system toxin component, PIN family [Rubrivivax sp.]